MSLRLGIADHYAYANIVVADANHDVRLGNNRTSGVLRDEREFIVSIGQRIKGGGETIHSATESPKLQVLRILVGAVGLQSIRIRQRIEGINRTTHLTVINGEGQRSGASILDVEIEIPS